MEFLTGLALLLLTLAGYSAGSVAAVRKEVTPALADIALVVILWVAALATRPGLGRWLAILVWFAVGFGLGAVGAALRRGRYPTENALLVPSAAHGWRRAWERWKIFSRRMGNYQSRVWLALFYLVAVAPLGVAMRLFSDPLRAKKRGGGSAWVARETPDADLESARSQF